MGNAESCNQYIADRNVDEFCNPDNYCIHSYDASLNSDLQTACDRNIFASGINTYLNNNYDQYVQQLQEEYNEPFKNYEGFTGYNSSKLGFIGSKIIENSENMDASASAIQDAVDATNILNVVDGDTYNEVTDVYQTVNNATSTASSNIMDNNVDETIENVEQSEEALNDAENSANIAQGAANSAQGAANNAENALEDAEDAVIDAEDAADDAEDAADDAENIVIQTEEYVEDIYNIAKQNPSVVNAALNITQNNNTEEAVVNALQGFSNYKEGFIENYESYDDAVNELISEINNMFDEQEIEIQQIIGGSYRDNSLENSTEYLLQNRSILNNLVLDYMINNEGTNVEQIYEKLSQKNKDRLRKIQVKSYYTKAYSEYIFLLKVTILLIILIIPIIFLNKYEILNKKITLTCLFFILVSGGLFIAYRIYLLSMRDNIDFDKIRIPYDRTAKYLVEQGEMEEKNSPLLNLGITCVGDECCDVSMTYDNLTNKCILSENFNNYFAEFNILQKKQY